MSIMNTCDKTCLEIFQQKHTIEILSAISATDEGIGFNAIQEQLGINTLSLQRRLEDLIDKKMITKKNCNNDSRSVIYSLLPRGKGAVGKLEDFRNFLIETV